MKIRIFKFNIYEIKQYTKGNVDIEDKYIKKRNSFRFHYFNEYSVFT
jgi:hypothetical protein